jgi:putative adhesin
VALLFAEAAIVALAVASFGGLRGSLAGGLHRVDYTAAAIAPLDAGAQPHVSVDVPNDRVVVTASNDGLVHVADRDEIHALMWGTPSMAPLHVSRTGDGVSVVRSDRGGTFTVFGGFSREHVEIALPPNATLTVARSSGADVTGLHGAVTVASQDGHITITDVSANVDVRSDDGYIDVTNVTAERVLMHTANGHLTLRDVAAVSLDVATEDGPIGITGLRVEGNSAHANLQTSDGGIELAFARNPSLTVTAETQDGRITSDGRVYRADGPHEQTFTYGAGAGTLRASTANGSIQISTNGAK